MKDERILRHAAPGGHIPRAFQPLHHVVLDFSLHQGQITQGHKAPDDRSAVRERILCRNLRGDIRPIVAQHPHALKGRPFGDAELRELGNERVIRQEGIARRPNVHIQHPDPRFIERFAARRVAQQRVFDPADAACALADVVHHACPRFPVPVCIPAQRKKLVLQADGRLPFCRAPRGFAEGRAVNRRGLFADMALPPPRIAIFQTVHPAFKGGAHVIDGQHIVNGSREKPDVEILQPQRRCAIEHPAVSVGKPIDVRAAVVLAPLRKNRRAVQLRLDERVTPILSAEGVALRSGAENQPVIRLLNRLPDMILRLPHRGVIHLQMRVILRIKERVVVSRAHEGKVLALSPDDRVIIPRARGSNRPIERAFQPPAVGRNRSGRDQADRTKNGRKQPCAFHFHQNSSLSLRLALSTI